MDITALLNALPNGVAQGLIWGIMAIGVYITYRILDVADLTVDGSLATGGAVCVSIGPVTTAALREFALPTLESPDISAEGILTAVFSFECMGRSAVCWQHLTLP